MQCGTQVVFKKMKLYRVFNFVFLILTLISCNEKSKEKNNLYVKGFADEKVIDCKTIKKYYNTKHEKYRLEDILPNWNVISSSNRKIKITNTIIEQNWKKGKSHFYVYTEKSNILIIVHFKNIDITELFVADDKRLIKLICKLVNQNKFILNKLSEEIPIMHEN